MKDEFVLKSADKLFKSIIERNYFKRYDLSNVHQQFNEYRNSFKKSAGRDLFVYDIIDIVLKSLDESLQKSVKKFLFEKNLDWFINTGQYFFYNLYEWAQKFNIYNKSGSKKNDFLKDWWNTFIEYENQVENQNYYFPEKILLELTNNCNLNCIMCGIGKNGYDPSRNISIDLLKSLCNEILLKTSLIRINGLGESTIIPHFLDYFDLICELPTRLEIVTNLTIQKKEIWNKMIEKQTNFLISCDSANPSKFESIRRGSKFERFIKNLKFIGENVSDPLQAQIIFTLMEQNIDDLTGVIEMASLYNLGGVIVNVVKENHNPSNWIATEIDRINNIFSKSYNLANMSGINLKLPDHLGNTIINEEISNPTCKTCCDNPWNEVYIRYNGDLTVCNMLNPYIYGNCKNYSFKKIWNGLNVFMFRKFVNTNFRHYYCRDCYYLV